MAYYKAINLVKGDDLPALEIVLRDSNKAASGQTLDIGDASTWSPIDLTSVGAVRLKIREIGSTTLADTITFTIINPATDGKIVMDWGATTLDIHGDYEGEVEMTYDNGRVLTVPDKFKFIIRDQF